MRITLVVAMLAFFLSACKKDKYTSTPQISYKSINTNVVDNNLGSISPLIIFTLTDAEGDVGITDKDTARIYIKNLLTQLSDSLDFPDLSAIGKDDFKAEVSASVGRLLGCIATNPAGRVDTLYYELYVKDFKKNQSNTIVTSDPIFQQCP